MRWKMPKKEIKKPESVGICIYMSRDLKERVRTWKEGQAFSPSFSQAVEYLLASALDTIEQKEQSK